jgi:hypothetical protein
MTFLANGRIPRSYENRKYSGFSDKLLDAAGQASRFAQLLVRSIQKPRQPAGDRRKTQIMKAQSGNSKN